VSRGTAARLAVIIVNWNSWADLERCLPSVEAEVGEMPAELVIVDSASTDDSAERVEATHPRWRVVRLADNVGFAAANNVGLAATPAPYVLLLNPDTVLEPGALATMLSAIEAEADLGVVGPLKLNADGSWQPSWGRFPTIRQEFMRQSLLARLIPIASPQGPRFTPGQQALLPHDRARDVDWVTCSGLLLRRAAVQGPLFQDGSYMYREEVDLCRRVRDGGWRVRYLPEARMLHLMGTSVARDRGRAIRLRLRGEALYFQLHGSPGQRLVATVLFVTGCAGRSVIYGLLALTARGARRRELLRIAAAYRASASELARSVNGRLDLQQVGAPRA
jgi:GT2 family glycosyltransferase